jgi:SPX domain protein involved in polyphosphate accumulation
MSQLSNNQSEELRHERKFLITDYSALEVEQLIKFNPACFTEIYHQRIVNNIYFDTLGFNNYFDNVEGQTERIKPRIRWYGNLFGETNNPILELKIKKGLLGKKEFYSLASFVIDNHFSRQQLLKAFKGNMLPNPVYDLMKSVYPTLLNSYTRNYFISADKNYRITIDKDLTFYGISYNNSTFLNKIKNNNAVVLELKYDSKLENEAKEIANNFPFAMTKSSKYVQGIESVLF